MQASKVTINKRLASSTLRPGQKRKLRERRFIDLVKSKPSGTPITYTEISRELVLSGTGSALGFVRSMAKAGKIAIDSSEKTNSYSVRDGRTIKSAHKEQPVTTIAEPAAQRIVREQDQSMSRDARIMRSLAMEFFWHEQSDSLRDFVRWIEQGNADKSLEAMKV